MKIQQPFKINLSVAFIGLIAATVFTITIYSYKKNAAAALELAERLIAQTAHSMIEKTNSHISPAMHLAKTSSFLLKSSAGGLKHNPQLEMFMLESMHNFTQLEMMYVGDPKGNFFMTARKNDGSLMTEWIDRSGRGRISRKFMDKFGKEINKTHSDSLKYDPRTRPWYLGAEKTKKPFWTDIYPSYDDNDPIITASYPVINNKGSVQYIIGVDIKLKELSRFLKSHKVKKHDVTLLLNEKLELIAHPDGINQIKIEGDSARFITVWEMKSKLVKKSVKTYLKNPKNHFTFSMDKKVYLTYFTSFLTTSKNKWYIVTIAPENDFVGSLKETQKTILIISILVLIFSTLLALLLSKSISRPIEILTLELRKIKDFHLDGEIKIQSHVREIQQMTEAVISMKSGLNSFRKYVPAELVRQLIKSGEGAKLGGQEREMTIFFSDIAGFTSISEGFQPQKLMEHLSEYLQELTEVIQDNSGTIDKYIGDCIMAFWGAPFPSDNHAVLSCESALGCQEKLIDLNNKWRASGKNILPTRIGLHTGNAVVGNMGSKDRLNYSVIGDTVNLASRLESVNKIYGTQIIVSESTYKKASGQFVFRPLDKVAVKGKIESISIYELIGRSGYVPNDRQQIAEQFSEAYDLYCRREWTEARKIFDILHSSFPEDLPSAMYAERCGEYIRQDPGPQWTGVTKLEFK